MAMRRVNSRGVGDWGWLFVLLLASSAVYFWLGWREVSGIVLDQGWFLQVSRRVASGEVLYRDVWWAYGPLPVLIMSGLMRLGNDDIVYFSLLHLTCAVLATWTLYRLSRYCLSPRDAAIATFFAMVGLGGWLPFLRIYTPGVPIGLLSMLVTLLGLVSYIRDQNSFKTSSLVVLGLLGSWLSKPEFAIGSLLLSLIVLCILRSVRLDRDTHPLSGKEIITGILIGLFLTTSVYWLLASQSGWLPLLNGISGYRQLEVLGGSLVGYQGYETLKMLAAATFLTVPLLLLAGSYAKSRRFWAIVPLGMGLFYLLGVLLWQSSWLSKVVHAQLSPLDTSAIVDHILAVIPSMPSFLRDQLFISISLLELLLLLALVPRWLRRVRRRESIPFERMNLLIVLLYNLLIGLRYFLFGAFELQLPGLVLLLLFFHSEFPSLGFPSWSARNWRSVVVICGLFPFVFNGVSLVWFASSNHSAYSSPYGEIFMYPSSRSFLLQTVEYIKRNSRDDDYIVVLGPFPGLYYLSQRHNPLLQDYIFPGVGDGETEVEDILGRLQRYEPTIVILMSESTKIGPGTLDMSSTAMAKIRFFVWEHYRFDQTLGDRDSWELSAYKILK